MDSEEMEHEFPFGKFRPEKQDTKMTQKVVFHLLSNWIFKKLFVNGKQSMLPDSYKSP